MELFAQEIGDGPRALLLVPGNDLCGDFYRPLAERLAARGCRVVLLDLPSTPAPGLDRLAGLVDAVRQACARHLPSGGLLVGHSFGGLVALLAAGAPAPAIQGVALLEPWIAPRHWLAAWMARGYRRRVVDRDRGRFENRPGLFRRLADPASLPRDKLELYLAVRRRNDPALIGAWLADAGELDPRTFTTLGRPTLVVRGAASGAWQRFALGWLARHLAPCERLSVPRAAHWLANEQDDQLADALASFAITAIDPCHDPASG